MLRALNSNGDSCIFAITFAVCLLTSIASAQSTGPIVTDRPTQSVATFTLATKVFEIEGGYKFSRTDDGDPNGSVTDLHEMPDALFRFGLWRGIEARVTVSGWDFEGVSGDESEQLRTNGFNDVSVGGKFAVVDAEGWRPAVSILADVSLPVGSEGFTNDYVNPKVLALLSNRLWQGWTLTVNFGPSIVRGNDETSVDLEYTAALGGEITSRWGFFAEFFGAFGVGTKRLDQHSFQTGVTALLSNDFQLDARVGVGFVDNVPAWFTGFGFGWRL